ncbi:GntR family transcriptional regulator, partial [Glycomyces tenuis]
PPVRQLAADLGLAVGTVGRAYRELEATGKVSSRRGGGTRVTADASPRLPIELAGALDRLSADYVSAARRLGAGDRDIVIAVQQALTSQEPH